LLEARGAKLVTVSDHTGAIRNSEGIDTDALALHVVRVGGVSGFAGAESVTLDQFYAEPVDVFIPAALEQMVDLARAQQIKCKVLAEAANAPTTPPAEKLLLEKGVAVLPAILCNAGGVTVSYFEWRQNRAAETWSPSFVDEQLKMYMLAAAQRVKETAKRYNCTLRVAALASALDNIAQVYRLRGIFP
jgi:glutamate dehydrogenase (NAD(P)+)